MRRLNTAAPLVRGAAIITIIISVQVSTNCWGQAQNLTQLVSSRNIRQPQQHVAKNSNNNNPLLSLLETSSQPPIDRRSSGHHGSVENRLENGTADSWAGNSTGTCEGGCGSLIKSDNRKQSERAVGWLTDATLSNGPNEQQNTSTNRQNSNANKESANEKTVKTSESISSLDESQSRAPPSDVTTFSLAEQGQQQSVIRSKGSRATPINHQDTRGRLNSLQTPPSRDNIEMNHTTDQLEYSARRDNNVHLLEPQFSLAHFDATLQTNVSVQLGKSAYLTCKLGVVHDNLVSWVRNMQILTSGDLRYTSDERYKPKHVDGTHDWILEIENVNMNDAGLYECQINTEPSAVSVPFQLNVIAASITIVDGTSMVVPSGADLHLTCIVSFNGSPHPSTGAGSTGASRESGKDLNWMAQDETHSGNNNLMYKQSHNGRSLGPKWQQSTMDDDDDNVGHVASRILTDGTNNGNGQKAKSRTITRRHTRRGETPGAIATSGGGLIVSNSNYRMNSHDQQQQQALMSRHSAVMQTYSSSKATVQWYVYWYKDGKSLNYDQQRPGLKISVTSENETHVISELSLESIRASDSGSYKCDLLPPLEGVPAAELELSISGSPSAGLFRSSRASYNAACAPFLLSLFVATLIFLRPHVLLH